MTQIELKIKIENTREDLNAAIAGNMTNKLKYWISVSFWTG